MYHRPEKKKQTLGFPICLLLFFIEILEAEYNFNKVEKGAINNKRRAFFLRHNPLCTEADTSLNKGRKINK